MIFRNTMNPFIRAHGSSTGPLMRPALNGFISGTASALSIYFLFLKLQILQDFLSHFGPLITFTGYLTFGAMTGILYGLIYRRSANDIRGGWIFGASTGFIFWMINPVIWWPWVGQGPILKGHEALIFMTSHILYGFLLGLFFPLFHRWTSIPLERLVVASKS